MDLTRELDVITRAARAAGELLRAEVARPGGPRGKGSKAPIDGEMGKVLVDAIARELPDDGVVIEDEGVSGRPSRSGRAFHIDPHDGTSDFLGLARRETSISVGLVDRGRLVLGVVHAPLPTPLTGDGFLAAWIAGGPVLRDGRPVSPPARPASALGPGSRVLVTFRAEHRFAELREELAPAAVEVCASIATRLALVALGDADVGLTVHGVDGYDIAGGQALLQGAGGELITGNGAPVTWRATELATAISSCYGARDLGLARDVAKRVQAVLAAPPRRSPPAKKPGLASSAGGVVIDDEGKILLRLRAPARGWTLAKGHVQAGETAEAAAVREVLEETGQTAHVVAAIPGEFPGDSTSTRYFLMRPEGPLGPHDSETAEVAWLQPAEAIARLGQTANRTRDRDLAVLEAARRLWLERRTR